MKFHIFLRYGKKLCPNPELAYIETDEKDVNCIKLAQDWIQWRLL
jgi:hypothetical protein